MVDFSGTSIGDTATYTCDIGFELIGSSVLNCQDGGLWDNSPPVCRRELPIHFFLVQLFHLFVTVLCPDLDNPVNGTVTQSGNSEGDTATYTCDSGYELVGQQVLNCQANGTWDTHPPICRCQFSNKLLD